MQFKFAILAAFVSAAVATTCQLQNLGALTVVAASQSGGQTRWDRFTVDSGAVHKGDIGWFVNNQPNGNEIFTAETFGRRTDLFIFRLSSTHNEIGVSGTGAGSRLLESPSGNSIGIFKVDCGTCFPSPMGNDLAADNCKFELTDGLNDLNQCVVFSSDAVVELQPCNDSNPAQNLAIFSVAL
ncbi:hypothetical protein FB451DRAFT_1387204 [Mycena latifolia]|nr:hypothetical protein FB451DRAFT_1387204 [Mycena latifolia]